MPFFRIEYIKTHKAKTAAYALILSAVIWLLYYFGPSLAVLFTSPESIREWVSQYGKAAPAALFALQALQVIVAPMNNFIVNFAGGYIFGPYYGFLYNYFGWIAGAIAVFWLARYFGRGFAKFFISSHQIQKFDKILGRGTYIMFMLLLLPGAPDDLLIYVIGLAKSIKFKTYLWMILIGKIPGKLATSFLGAGVAEHSAIPIALYAVFIIASSIVFVKKPDLWRLGKGDLQK